MPPAAGSALIANSLQRKDLADCPEEDLNFHADEGTGT
jgi:hypothetical protein